MVLVLNFTWENKKPGTKNHGAKKGFESSKYDVSGLVSSASVAAELNAEKAVYAHATMMTLPAISNLTKLQTKL